MEKYNARIMRARRIRKRVFLRGVLFGLICGIVLSFIIIWVIKRDAVAEPKTNHSSVEKQEKEAYENKYDDAIAWIRDNSSMFTENQVKAAEENQDFAVFLYRWKTGDYEQGSASDVTLTKKEKNSEIPAFYQWDKRWGYLSYGNGVIGTSGCGPTCLAMVACGLLRDESINPARVAEFALNNDWYLEGTGTKWGLFRAYSDLHGLRCRNLDRDSQIIDALRAGNPVICSMRPGDFTYEGHFIVLRAIDKDGMVTVNDPINVERSRKKWDFDGLYPQIKHAWGFNA